MRVYLKSILYILPFLVTVILIESIGWLTGETKTLEAISKWQDEGEGRVWRGGDGKSYVSYKLIRIKKLKPDVIFMGSSRANSFRREDFDGVNFYNASLTGWTFDHYIKFLEIITSDGYAPKIIFFNMDFFILSDNEWWNNLWVDRFYPSPPSHVSSIKGVADYLYKSTDWPWKFGSAPAVFPGAADPNVKIWNKLKSIDQNQGLFAVLNNKGFRSDGSLLEYMNLVPDTQRLELDGCVLPVGGEIGDNQLKLLNKFADIAASKNIKLIGVHMPLADRQLLIQEKAKNNKLWNDMRSKKMIDYYKSKGILFLDYADLKEYRYKSERWLDSLHPDVSMVSDVATRINNNREVLQIYSDVLGYSKK